MTTRTPKELADALDAHAVIHENEYQDDNQREWAKDLRDAAAALRAGGWRPIADAPKDGTYILAAREGEDLGIAPIEVIEWCSFERFHWEHVEGDLYRKVVDKPDEFWNGNGHRATHWMPLPPAPESE